MLGHTCTYTADAELERYQLKTNQLVRRYSPTLFSIANVFELYRLQQERLQEIEAKLDTVVAQLT